MNAKKCDVCGKFFMPYLEDYNDIPSMYRKIKVQSYDMSEYLFNEDTYDICEDCTVSLEKWLESQGLEDAEAR